MKTIEEAAEMVLRAAGSSLKNYTIPATREAILQAISDIQIDAHICGGLRAIKNMREGNNP